MEQRRLRLGDILDDYCPRERRITNHAVVAMIDDQIRQTRCTTCEAEHAYKAAQMVPKRMKKAELTPSRAGSETDGRAPVEGTRATPEAVSAPAPIREASDADAGGHSPAMLPSADEAGMGEVSADAPEPLSNVEDGSVRRSLIRATLQRPNGQPPVRSARNLTVRSTAGHSNGLRNGDSRGGPHGNRQGDGGSGSPGRAGGARHVGARPAWLGRETSGRPVQLSHHPSRRSPDGSRLHTRQAGKVWPARHGKKRSK